MSFATWVSPEFQLYIMKDYRRLKTDENSRLSLNWNLNREISKLNYRIHTDAIKENLLPPELTLGDKRTARLGYSRVSCGKKVISLRWLCFCPTNRRSNNGCT